MDDIFLWLAWLAIGLLLLLIFYIAYEMDRLKEENERIQFVLDSVMEAIKKMKTRE